MGHRFYSNGKLLITGEYAILDGASGLAVPTRYGQALRVKEQKEKGLSWQAKDETGKIWFQAHFNVDLEPTSSTDDAVATRLTSILKAAKGLNPNWMDSPNGQSVETTRDFPAHWGLGTSSTLINNVAQWTGVNAYALLEQTFGGSGYDIACAVGNDPIVYALDAKKNPVVVPVHFTPPFASQLFFVHLNQKQNSRTAIAAYRAKTAATQFFQEVSRLTQAFVDCRDLPLFQDLMEEHEALLSKTLEIAPVKERLFPDYFGAIKSLGAWGGDFVMATGNENTRSYFEAKGFGTVIPFSKMLL
ncbi:GYDIA family GHMP kinase [Maribacter sp. 2307ULW6-5]|uniref:GYDIA family GHMP kinase n=1 Tax=Maribacter sp. 2307ULW6-5 TaxID=3386275 RepID=UPI0039BC2CA9